MKSGFAIITLILGLACSSFAAGQSRFSAIDLRCEYLVDPIGIDVVEPQLSWKLKSDVRGQKQTAYRVLVASSRTLLNQNTGDRWDSGKVQSDQSVHVAYAGPSTGLMAGKALESRMPCFWKVMVWDKDGNASGWSEVAHWRMGLLEPGDWTAQWIQMEKVHDEKHQKLEAQKKVELEKIMALQPKPQPGKKARKPKMWGLINNDVRYPWMRKTFDLSSPVEDAWVYISTPGYYELYVNGKKVGDDVLGPAYCQIKKRYFYHVRDVSKYLVEGKNCLALWMAPAWYQPAYGFSGSPIVRAQLEVETAEGLLRVATDETWKVKNSCISQIGAWGWNNFGGEQWNASEYIKDWNQASCDDSSWVAAVEAQNPGVICSWQALPGSRLSSPLKPERIYQHEDKWVFDFGTTLTGWCRLRMAGIKPGQIIEVEYADLDAERRQLAYRPSLNTDGFQTFNQRDRYIGGAETEDTFCSKFNRHGFRYVIVSGLKEKPALSDAEAMMIMTDLPEVGQFECSNALFNDMYRISLQTSRSQVPCGVLGGGEAREHEGYGDGGSFLTGFLYQFDSASLYRKWIQDWIDNQEPNGHLHNTAPSQRKHGGGPSWGGQMSALVRRMHLYYGDLAQVRKSYDHLRAYVDFIESKTKDDILRAYSAYGSRTENYQFLGDWARPQPDPKNTRFIFGEWDEREFFNNCYRGILWQDLADFAKALGDTAELERCTERLAVLRPLIHATWYDAEKGRYKIDLQANLAIALLSEVVPDALRPTVFKQLEDDLVIAKKGHLDAGLQGSAMLIELFRRENRQDLIALMAGQVTYPGWGYLVRELKVTTWPETWAGGYSQNIHVVGTINNWFYEGLAGISPDPTQPGFKHFTIRPGMVDSVDWVKCSYDSPYGPIVSNWHRKGDRVTMEVTIPANSTATVYVPAKAPSDVTVNGKALSEADHVTFLRMDNGEAVLKVGSGEYMITSNQIKKAEPVGRGQLR